MHWTGTAIFHQSSDPMAIPRCLSIPCCLRATSTEPKNCFHGFRLCCTTTTCSLRPQVQKRCATPRRNGASAGSSPVRVPTSRFPGHCPPGWWRNRTAAISKSTGSIRSLNRCGRSIICHLKAGERGRVRGRRRDILVHRCDEGLGVPVCASEEADRETVIDRNAGGLANPLRSHISTLEIMNAASESSQEGVRRLHYWFGCRRRNG